MLWFLEDISLYVRHGTNWRTQSTLLLLKSVPVTYNSEEFVRVVSNMDDVKKKVSQASPEDWSLFEGSKAFTPVQISNTALETIWLTAQVQLLFCYANVFTRMYRKKKFACGWAWLLGQLHASNCKQLPPMYNQP